jgi:hypothetical protein
MTVNIPVEVQRTAKAGRGQVKSIRGDLTRLRKRYDRLAKTARTDQICAAGCSAVREAIIELQTALDGLERTIESVTTKVL